MPQSAVVDASVLVSAFLFADSVPGRVLRLAAEGGFAMHLSPILVEETRRSLLNPACGQPTATTKRRSAPSATTLAG
jgi:hypothetical protein